MLIVGSETAMKTMLVVASLVCFTPCLAAPEWKSRFLSGVDNHIVANAKVNEAYSRPTGSEISVKEATNAKKLVKEQQTAFRHSTIVNVIALPDEDYQPPEETFPQDPYYNQYFYVSYFLTPNNNMIPIYNYYWPSAFVYSPYDY